MESPVSAAASLNEAYRFAEILLICRRELLFYGLFYKAVKRYVMFHGIDGNFFVKLRRNADMKEPLYAFSGSFPVSLHNAR